MSMSAWERFPLAWERFPFLTGTDQGQCGGMQEAAHPMAVLGVTAFRQVCSHMATPHLVSINIPPFAISIRLLLRLLLLLILILRLLLL